MAGGESQNQGISGRFFRKDGPVMGPDKIPIPGQDTRPVTGAATGNLPVYTENELLGCHA